LKKVFSVTLRFVKISRVDAPITFVSYSIFRNPSPGYPKGIAHFEKPSKSLLKRIPQPTWHVVTMVEILKGDIVRFEAILPKWV
jgi:hypothetical protein